MDLSGHHLAWTPLISTKGAVNATEPKISIQPFKQNSSASGTHVTWIRLQQLQHQSGWREAGCHSFRSGARHELLPAEWTCGLPVLATPSQTGSAQKMLAR